MSNRPTVKGPKANPEGKSWDERSLFPPSTSKSFCLFLCYSKHKVPLSPSLHPSFPLLLVLSKAGAVVLTVRGNGIFPVAVSQIRLAVPLSHTYPELPLLPNSPPERGRELPSFQCSRLGYRST
jgi:hypothetical protein